MLLDKSPTFKLDSLYLLQAKAEMRIVEQHFVCVSVFCVTGADDNHCDLICTEEKLAWRPLVCSYFKHHTSAACNSFFNAVICDRAVPFLGKG